MKIISRLSVLLLIGVAALLSVGLAAGAPSVGLTRDQVPASVVAARQAPTTEPVPMGQAVPVAQNDPVPSAAATPAGTTAAVAAATTQNQPGTVTSTTTTTPSSVAAQPAASVPSVVLPPSRVQVAVSTNRPILGKPSDTAAITTVVTDAGGAPLAGVPVTFSLDDAAVGQLTVTTAITDANGVATTSFSPEVFRGAATITATTDSGASGVLTIRISCGC